MEQYFIAVYTDNSQDPVGIEYKRLYKVNQDGSGLMILREEQGGFLEDWDVN